MIFNKSFSDFINLLERDNIKYVLVGGMAVLMNGHFRTTKDMDIFYEPTEENCLKLLKVIDEFGFKYLGITKEDLLDKAGFIKIGNEPQRIDLFCDLPGVSFDEVYKSAFNYKEDEESFVVKVIHINHLIQNKKAVGRHQDLDDVKKLEKILQRRKK